MSVETQPAAPNQFLISNVYKPWAHQVAFHQSSAKCRLQVGSFGSGKSMPLLWEGIFHALEYPGSESIIFRKTVPDLTRSVISNFEQKIPKELYADYNQQKRIVTFHPVKRRRIVVDEEKGAIWQKTNTLKNCQMMAAGRDCLDRNIPLAQQCLFCRDHEVVQSKLYFGACEKDKDVGKYLSTGYVYIGFEELGEFGFFIWSSLRSRNRCDIPGSRPCMAGATNPFGIGWGWIKRLWVDRKPAYGMRPEDYDPEEYEFVHSTVDQNPIYSRDKEYMAQLERDPRRAQVRYGKLDSVSGQYFANFEMGRHIRPKSDFIFHDWQPATLGWDYGFGHWFVTSWLTKATLKPRFAGDAAKIVNVFFREVFDQEQTPKMQVDQILTMMPRKMVMDEETNQEKEVFAESVEGIHLSWERFNRTTSNYTVAMEIGDLLEAAGLPRPQSSNRVERIAGWTKMYQLFDADELFFVEGACPTLAESIPLLVRGDGITTDLEDVVKPKGAVLSDDCGDSMRYAIAGALLDAEDKPDEMKRKEAISKIKEPIARAVAMYRQHNIEQAEQRRGTKEIVVPTWRKKVKE